MYEPDVVKHNEMKHLINVCYSPSREETRWALYVIYKLALNEDYSKLLVNSGLFDAIKHMLKIDDAWCNKGAATLAYTLAMKDEGFHDKFRMCSEINDIVNEMNDELIKLEIKNLVNT